MKHDKSQDHKVSLWVFVLKSDVYKNKFFLLIMPYYIGESLSDHTQIQIMCLNNISGVTSTSTFTNVLIL